MGNAIVTSCSTSAPLPSKETENETFMAGSSQSSLFLEQWKRQFSWQDPSLERKNVKDTLSCRICFHDSSPYTTLNDNNWSLYANEVQLAIKFLGDCIPICQQCSFLSHVICFTILHCFHDFRCECKHTPFTCVDCQHHYDSLHEVIPQMICLACAIAPEKYIPFFPQNTELHEAHQLLLHTIQNDNNNVQTILCGIQKSKLLQQIKNHLLTNCYQAIQEITHLCYNCFFLDQELMAKKLPPLSMQLLQKDHAMQKNYAEDNRPFFSLLTCQFSQDNRDFFEQQYLFEQMEYAVVQKIRDFDPEKITEICNALSSITSHKFEADGIQTRILFKITSISSLIDLIIRDATMLERLRQHLPQREEILEILEESPCILTEQNDTHIGHLLFILLTEGKLIENECAQEKQDDTRIGHLLFILQRTIQDDQNTLQKDAAFIKKTTSAIHLYSQICQAGISFDKFLQKPFLQTHRQFLLKHTHQSIDIDLLRIYADALHAFLLEQLRFRHQTQPFDNPQYILSIIPQSLDKEEKNSRPFSFLQKILSQEIPNLSMQELFAMASLHTSSFVNQLILIYHAKKDPTKVHKKIILSSFLTAIQENKTQQFFVQTFPIFCELLSKMELEIFRFQKTHELHILKILLKIFVFSHQTKKWQNKINWICANAAYLRHLSKEDLFDISTIFRQWRDMESRDPPIILKMMKAHIAFSSIPISQEKSKKTRKSLLSMMKNSLIMPKIDALCQNIHKETLHHIFFSSVFSFYQEPKIQQFIEHAPHQETLFHCMRGLCACLPLFQQYLKKSPSPNDMNENVQMLLNVSREVLRILFVKQIDNPPLFRQATLKCFSWLDPKFLSFVFDDRRRSPHTRSPIANKDHQWMAMKLRTFLNTISNNTLQPHSSSQSTSCTYLKNIFIIKQDAFIEMLRFFLLIYPQETSNVYHYQAFLQEMPHGTIYFLLRILQNPRTQKAITIIMQQIQTNTQKNSLALYLTSIFLSEKDQSIIFSTQEHTINIFTNLSTLLNEYTKNTIWKIFIRLESWHTDIFLNTHDNSSLLDMKTAHNYIAQQQKQQQWHKALQDILLPINNNDYVFQQNMRWIIDKLIVEQRNI